MAKIFITGSADGLGQLAAQALISQGHLVVLHARNAARAAVAQSQTPGAAGVLVGDLSDLDQVRALAEAANKLGAFDAVIHNAGVYQVPAAQLLAVNTLAPYILTCAMAKPGRLIYLSSGMHMSGHARLEELSAGKGRISYSDTKLHVLLLCKAVGRLWPDVQPNAVDPGWVPTKMGGAGAPDDLQEGYETQVWLATGAAIRARGAYFYHRQERRHNAEADDVQLQDRFLEACFELTGVRFPG